MKKVIEIYTDGSSVVNENVLIGNGWAYYIPSKSIEASGKVYESKDGSFSRMELLAIVEALKYVAQNKGSYLIHCDSLSTVRCFRGEGSRKMYKDLWSQIYELIKKAHSMGSTIDIKFLDRKTLSQKSVEFSYAQHVDKLAFQQANSLCILA